MSDTVAPDPLAMASLAEAPIGIVAIGRNEGARLRACLASLVPLALPTVYVDSASTDQSVAVARQQGVTVVPLDDRTPLTAARARNAGLEHLQRVAPHVQFVQFLDADCVLEAGWLEAAYQRMRRAAALAVVFGRRFERDATRNMYHRVIDMEWDLPVGPAPLCGGDALMRIAALHSVGGFNGSLICGEEPELCYRLGQAGWHIERIGWPMTEHDVAMDRFGQWWARRVRGGWAFAEGAALYGQSARRSNRRAAFSTGGWAIGLPLLVLVSAWPTGGWALLLLLAYPLLGLKIAYRTWRLGYEPGNAIRYALGCVIGKWPECAGQLRYWWHRFRRQKARLIEYKQAEANP